MSSWWAGKAAQFVRHVTGKVSEAELGELRRFLTREQFALFESMHRADQRHGLDVVASLRNGGRHERDLLLAGLFHDAGKGPRVGLWHRVAWSLHERYGAVRSLALRLPGFRDAFVRIERHPERSAELALDAGCSEITADLIRNQSRPRDPVLGEALRVADELN